MRNFVRVSVIGILFVLAAGKMYAQSSVTIDPASFRDSTTFVNLKYVTSSSSNEYPLTLKFSGMYGKYTDIQVNWGEEGAESPKKAVEAATTTQFSYTYKTEKCFPIQMYFFPGSVAGKDADTLCAWALNTDLFLSYALEPVGQDKSLGCLSYGSDTLLLRFTSNTNPPRTQYVIDINCRAPMIHSEGEMGGTIPVVSPSEIDLENNWVHACWANQGPDRRDSIWLIFTEATGVEGAEITVKMICNYTDDKGRADYMEKKCHQTESVYLFDKPDLREIFRQDVLSSFPETLEALPLDDQNFNVCAPGAPNEFGFYGDWFAKYQGFVLHKPSPKPEDRNIFKVTCYYTEDSVWSDNVTPGDDFVKWKDVSGNSEYFNDTTLTFNRAGFYMVRWEIHNQCDEEHHDTLWTSLIRKGDTDEYYDDKFRYIQVYENQEASLDYIGDSVFCLNVKDSVILVDRNRRKFYDVPPDYSLKIVDMDTRVVIEERSVGLAETKIYRDGNVLNTGADAGNFSKVERKGCDSTTITLPFKKPGNYEVTWERKGKHCEEGRTKVFEFHVGNKPEIRDTILRHCYKDKMRMREIDGAIYHCGPYEFKVPDLSDAFDAHNRTIDSVRYKFVKGTRDSVLTYKGDVPEVSYLFDSTGTNYILVNIYNGCGVSETDSFGFYTPTQPADLSIWRDSVEVTGTDTLCLNAEYKYYLHGVLPKNYEDSVFFSGSVYINGISIVGGSIGYSKLRKRNENYGLVKYTTKGEYTESYWILNKDFPQCSEGFKEKVVVVDAPDSMIYKDSEILYCASMDTLDTRVLFKEIDKDKNPVEPTFKRAAWGWTGGEPAKEGRFPKFLFRDDKNDTLYVSTIQSMSCYYRDTIVFKPQAVPQANLNPIEEICAPDTLKSQDYLDFVKNGNLASVTTMQWKVYKNAYYNNTDKDTLVYNSEAAVTNKIILNEQSADSLGLIYWMQNVFKPMYKDFGDDGCWRLDTLPVKVHKPRLKILKKDTLQEGDNGVYDFAEIQNNYLDTKDLNNEPLEWTVGWDDEDGSFDGNTPPKYTLGEKDKKLDSLLFVLTAHTYCGDPISDTLVVYFPRIIINAHRDTICVNTVDYALWGPGKTTGLFVNTETLQWKIIKDASGGTLSAETGTDVKYKPGTSPIDEKDTVKIEVTGTSTADVGTKSDTVLLWINPAPSYTPLVPGDTLIAIDQKINIGNIKALKYQHVSGLQVKDIHLTATSWVETEGDSLIKSTIDLTKATKNSKFTADITLKALPGCEDVEITGLPMMDLVRPGAEPKYSPLDMCAGEEYGIDSLVTFKDDQKDRFTTLKWEITKGTGSWKKDGDDTVAYVAGSTGGIDVERISLKMNKRYVAYDSTVQSLLPSDAERPIKVNVYDEPIIGFKNNKDRDTLCKEDNTIEITRGQAQAGATEWVLVQQAYYVDSLRFNGQKLPADNKYAFRKDRGEEDTVYVTVNQGRCTKWASVQKKLYLYRMDKVLDSDLLKTSYKICEGGSVEIEYTGTLTTPYHWEWNKNVHAGSLDSTGKGLKPVYSDTAGINGQIELHTIPHPGCDEEYVFTNVEVTKKPRLNLKDKPVCKTEGNDLGVEIVFANGNSWHEADSITWYRKGTTGQLGKSLSGDDHFSYLLTAADITLDTFHLVAALWPKTPCDKSPTYDTIKIALSGQPEITLPGTSPAMCQGDTLDLLRESGVTIKNVETIKWNAINWGTVVADTLYAPGEKDGSASLKITAKGAPGCLDDVKNITVEVRKAPRPDFTVNTDPACQKGQIELEAKTISGVTVTSWQWEVENQSHSGAKISHTFEASGQVDVYLQETYSYAGTTEQCVRDATLPVTVHPKPTADFEDVGQVAIGSTVTIHNLSTPAGLTYKWDVDGVLTPYTDKDLTLTFNVAASVGITLTVETDKHCSDSKSGTVEVVKAPVPDFRVDEFSCADTAKFTFTGDLNGASVWWDWGTGQGLEQDLRIDRTQPIKKTYYVGYQDTTYWVTLELRNAADTVQKKLPVRFVSRLDASFKILPEKTGCHEIYRKISLDIKGRNDEGYVIWGDKWYNPDPKNVDSVAFRGNNVYLLSHRFENPRLEPVKDTIRLHVRNTCFSKADTNYLTVLPASAGAEIGLINGSSLCFEEEVLKVENASYGFDKATAEWEWKFEPGSAWGQSNRDTATYRYLFPGEYTVILNMRDRCNSDTAMQKITVRGNDSLWFEVLPKPYCTNQMLTMKFEQRGEAEFSDLRWTIYEVHTGRSLRAVADSTQITYKFRNTGDYSVLLTAKAEGCNDRQEIPLHINETPDAMISLINESVMKGCEPHTVEFQAADGSGLRQMPHIYWDFQNDVKSSELKEKVVFENEGIYNVSLTLVSDSGCVSTTQQEIIVEHTPRISFVTNDSLFCTENGTFEVAIENMSEDLERCRFEWFKKIGAGAEESIIVAPELSSPLRFENVSGTIGLRLFATDLQTGCKQNFIKEIVASESMDAHIFKETEYVCLDNPVYFASRTENMAKAEWDMGDGGISADTAFEYTYDRVGDKMITLRVENKDGCYDTDTMHITVYPLPVADFEWKKNSGIIEGYPDTLDLPEVDNGGVEFTNYSIVTPEDWGTELYYSWNFGDSTALNAAKNPTHRFENNGLYEVWLKATTAYGCVDSVARTVSIDAVKGLYIPTAFAPAMPDEELGEGNSYMGSARFQPKGIGLYSYQIQVYEPWGGTCVWSSTALKNGQPAEYWDGKFNGADAPAGNYIWKVNAIFIDGSVWVSEKGSKEGLVMLIR